MDSMSMIGDHAEVG
jgi:hypothetical protein